MDGRVTADGEPLVWLPVAGQRWPACIDTGFNGDLELPEPLRPVVNPRYIDQITWDLAGGQDVEEELYQVDFPFDGEIHTVEATFVDNDRILIGTHMIRAYRLDIRFRAQTVLLEREELAP